MSTIYACSNIDFRHGEIAARKDYAITGSSGHAHALAGKEICKMPKKKKKFAALGEILVARVMCNIVA